MKRKSLVQLENIFLVHEIRKPLGTSSNVWQNKMEDERKTNHKEGVWDRSRAY